MKGIDIMDKNDMPANFSYILLVHAGSYKDFNKKIARDFENLTITAVKQKAVHYYIVQVTENGKTEYKKDDIYKLPIMAMREEFSNYLFFKSVKAYNNVLKLMCNGKTNQNAPYDLYLDMLTGLEKLKYGNVNKDTKELSFCNGNNKTTVYGSTICKQETLNELFNINELQLNGETINLIDKLKEQKLIVGVI